MKITIKSVTSASPLLALLAIGACGNLTEGNANQPIGELALVSSGSDGYTQIPSTTQRVTVTGTGSIGTVTVVSFSGVFGGEAVAIAPDGTPWFTGFGKILRIAPDDTTWVVQMPSGGGDAPAIVPDGLGAMWMVNWSPAQGVGRINPANQASQMFSVPNPLSRPTALASDGQGGVWLGGGDRPIVGRVDQSNHVFVVAAENAPAPITVSTGGVAIASDGQIFISDYDQGRIGRVRGTGFIWTDLASGIHPSGLAAGDDGSVWFVAAGAQGQVGRVDHDGQLQAYALPPWPDSYVTAALSTITRGPDGAFWFALSDVAQIGRVSTDGELSFIQLDSIRRPQGLAFDSRGRLWLTDVLRIEF
jgi:streptogramin lyase